MFSHSAPANSIGIACLLLLGASLLPAAHAEDTADAEFAKIDKKVNTNIDRKDWSPASREFVKALWAEYRQAHLKNEQKMSYSGRGKLMPTIQSYNQYLGRYTMKGERGAFLEVINDEQGRYFVQLEGHRIPAVAWNKMILFTTGDVVNSKLPDLGSNVHATLEFFVLARSSDDYFFSAPGEPLDAGRKLVKLPDGEGK
jgi:hypothetical protein